MTTAYIVDAVRTPRGGGKLGKGALTHLHPQHLGATVLKALRERNNLDTSRVDDIIWSTSQQRGKQGVISAGCRRSMPAMTPTLLGSRWIVTVAGGSAASALPRRRSSPASKMW